MNKLIKKADIFLILIILLACCAFLVPRYFSTGSLQAVIYKNGEELSRVSLSEVNESHETRLDCVPAVTVRFEKDGVCFSHAECRDKLCVLAGKLEHKGDIAACLPAGVVIVMEGSDRGLPDAITY